MFDLIPRGRRGDRRIGRFGSELDRLYDRFFSDDVDAPEKLSGGESFFPLIDVAEGKKDITIKAEIPGMEADDLDVSLDGRTLIIKGEKKQEKEEKEENYHRMERSFGFFSRTVPLSADVDPLDVQATYKKGVLRVVLKKTKESEATKIKIR